MVTTLRTVARSQLRTQKLRFALTSVGIAIAAFFVSAVLVLGNSLYTSTKNSVSDFYATTDAVVQSPSSFEAAFGQGLPLQQKYLDKVLSSDLIKSAWPLVQNHDYLSWDSEPNQNTGYPSFRYDMPTDTSLFPYHLTEGEFPTGDYQVLVSSADAQEYGLKVGQKVKLTDYTAATAENIQSGSIPTADFTVSGIYGVEPGSKMQGATFTGGDTGAQYIKLVRETWGENQGKGEATTGRVLVTFKDPNTTVAELQASLGYPPADQVKVATVTEQIDKDIDTKIRGSFFLFYALLGFAALALLMAAFLISNTLQIIAQQRTRELALLRVLGATKAGLSRMMLAEAALLGLTSSLAGAVTAYLLVFIIDRWGGFGDTYIKVSYSLLPALLAILVCTLTTTFAALLPALRAYRTSPLEALRSPQLEQQTRSRAGLYVVLALMLVLGGWVFLLGVVWKDEVVFFFVSTFALATLAVTLLPLVLRPLLVLLVKVTRPFTPASFALASAQRSRVQTASTGRMLFTCAALVAAVLTGYSTVKTTTLNQLEQDYPYDIQTTLEVGYSDALALEKSLADVSELAAATVLLPQGTSQDVKGSGMYITYSSVDPQALTTLLPQVDEFKDDELLVEADYAQQLNLTEGDTLLAEGTDGKKTLKVHTVDTKNAIPQGAFITRQTGEALSGHNLLEGDLITLVTDFKPGLSKSEQNQAISNIASVMGVEPKLLYGLLPAQQDAEETLNVALISVLILLGITVLISFIGIINTQVLNGQQRAREYALLRAM
ncbi:MAG: ABC transporter permease, partial [Rothia sp. (in: high G+C Gram-positive bacteria)]|nr:ABC transporter permease [Rothia sp. (in: high G+C Gram-positive bacteria)]